MLLLVLSMRWQRRLREQETQAAAQRTYRSAKIAPEPQVAASNPTPLPNGSMVHVPVHVREALAACAGIDAYASFRIGDDATRDGMESDDGAGIQHQPLRRPPSAGQCDHDEHEHGMQRDDQSNALCSSPSDMKLRRRIEHKQGPEPDHKPSITAEVLTDAAPIEGTIGQDIDRLDGTLIQSTRSALPALPGADEAATTLQRQWRAKQRPVRACGQGLADHHYRGPPSARAQATANLEPRARMDRQLTSIECVRLRATGLAHGWERWRVYQQMMDVATQFGAEAAQFRSRRELRRGLASWSSEYLSRRRLHATARSHHLRRGFAGWAMASALSTQPRVTPVQSPANSWQQRRALSLFWRALLAVGWGAWRKRYEGHQALLRRSWVATSQITRGRLHGAFRQWVHSAEEELCRGGLRHGGLRRGGLRQEVRSAPLRHPPLPHGRTPAEGASTVSPSAFVCHRSAPPMPLEAKSVPWRHSQRPASGPSMSQAQGASRSASSASAPTHRPPPRARPAHQTVQ